MIAAGIINRSSGYQAIKKIAFVVDCDETNIRAYNARALAPHRTKMLPERVTLVQATTDTGGEYLPNAVLKYALHRQNCSPRYCKRAHSYEHGAGSSRSRLRRGQNHERDKAA
jgi:hypothetical protein